MMKSIENVCNVIIDDDNAIDNDYWPERIIDDDNEIVVLPMTLLVLPYYM